MKAGGYTLLELIVVLAVLGLATALVGPAGFRMLTSWQLATERDTILDSLSALSLRAHERGRELHFDRGEVAAGDLIELPEGWRLRLDEPLHVRANGACTGAQGTLETPSRVFAIALDAPFCRARLRETN